MKSLNFHIFFMKADLQMHWLSDFLKNMSLMEKKHEWS